MHASVSPLQTERSVGIAHDYRCAIQVAPPNDRQLAAQVKAALIAAGDITARQILIEATDGVVFLSGTVDSDAMRHTTLAVARLESGVHNVVDQLVLRSELREALARGKRKRRI